MGMGAIKGKANIEMRANSNCWICEGWSQYYFEFTAPVWVDLKVTPVKLHLSCDDFRGEVLEANEKLSAEKSAPFDLPPKLKHAAYSAMLDGTNHGAHGNFGNVV